jgi:hypothetical protein
MNVSAIRPLFQPGGSVYFSCTMFGDAEADSASGGCGVGPMGLSFERNMNATKGAFVSIRSMGALWYLTTATNDSLVDTVAGLEVAPLRRAELRSKKTAVLAVMNCNWNPNPAEPDECRAAIFTSTDPRNAALFLQNAVSVKLFFDETKANVFYVVSSTASMSISEMRLGHLLEDVIFDPLPPLTLPPTSNTTTSSSNGTQTTSSTSVAISTITNDTRMLSDLVSEETISLTLSSASVGGLGSDAVIGIVAGAVALFVLLVAALTCWTLRRRQKNADADDRIKDGAWRSSTR